MALSSQQRRKARESLARKRGVAESSISDGDITAAVTAQIITTSDYGTASYDCGSSSSSYGDSGGGSFSCD